MAEETSQHYRDRLDRVEAENLRLHETVERLRGVLRRKDAEALDAIAAAYYDAARVAQFNVTSTGDRKEYPSVIGMAIHDAIVQRLEEMMRRWRP